MIKSFKEIVAEAVVDTSKDPYRLVVLADRPKKLNEKGTSQKIIKTAEKLLKHITLGSMVPF